LIPDLPLGTPTTAGPQRDQPTDPGRLKGPTKATGHETAGQQRDGLKAQRPATPTGPVEGTDEDNQARDRRPAAQPAQTNATRKPNRAG